MNITQLNFSDYEYKKLVNAYIHILITAVHIDGRVDKKEIGVLLSLITRVDNEGDNSFLGSLNFIKKTHNLDSKYLLIDENNFDFIRVFDLENIIFQEASKSLHQILSKLSEQSIRTHPQKIEDLSSNLNTIKTIIESKSDILGKDYINVFYYGIYFYTECIAKQVGKMFGGKIVPEEREYLDIIKEFYEIRKAPTESLKESLRKPILDI